MKKHGTCSRPVPLFAERVHIAVANVAHWNKRCGSSLILAKDRLKQSFEFSSERLYTQRLCNDYGLEVWPGVLEDGMEHHAQALVALSISSALCLGAWIWARRRLDRFQARVDGHDRT
jgi:hypothetical protein